MLQEEYKYFASTGLRYQALDLSHFHDVPTVLVVLWDRAGLFSVGAASAPTPAVWRKAFIEAFQAYDWTQVLHKTVQTDFLSEDCQINC
ncbi:YcaO-like family protein [Ktedonosporobacter rubrisoli]|uniref:YcaO-like family protein n=1 Tax=Ktedonosporobacter rubrisoli TaxID=2509675 RepID=UPI0024140D51|nr:YcaO-like family protein [Ktedonosporobacter rubrisoli]